MDSLNTKEELSAFIIDDMKRNGINDPAVPLEKQIDYWIGLSTQRERKAYVTRIRIKREIEDRMRSGRELSCADIARTCNASEETVERVYRAVLFEYPARTAEPADCRVALPKNERAFKMVKEILDAANLEVQMTNDKLQLGSIVDKTTREEVIPCMKIAGKDIVHNLKDGDVCIALLGNDKIIEIDAETALNEYRPLGINIIDSFKENAFRMCFAIPREKREEAEKQGLDYLKGKKIVTTYANTLEAFLAEKDITARTIMPRDGTTEAYTRRRCQADAVMDIVQYGDTIREAGLVTFGSPIYTGRIDLFELNGMKVANDDQVRVDNFCRRIIEAKRLAA